MKANRLWITVVASLCSISVFAQNDTVIVPVKDLFNIAGIGVMVTGKLQSGTLKPGMVLEARGHDKTAKVTVGKIFINNKEVPSATGEEITFNARGVKPADLEMGMVLATPGILKAGKLANATISLLTKEDGLTTALKNNATVQVILYDNTVYANLLLKDITELQPGAKADVQLKFSSGMAATPTTPFTLKVYGKTVGAGIIISISEQD